MSIHQIEPIGRSAHDPQFQGTFPQPAFFTDELYRHGAFHSRHGFFYAQLIVILQTIDAHAGSLHRRSLVFGRFYCCQDDIIAAQFTDLFQGLPAGTFTNAEHSYYTAHSEDYAQNRQHRA